MKFEQTTQSNFLTNIIMLIQKLCITLANCQVWNFQVSTQFARLRYLYIFCNKTFITKLWLLSQATQTYNDLNIVIVCVANVCIRKVYSKQFKTTSRPFTTWIKVLVTMDLRSADVPLVKLLSQLRIEQFQVHCAIDFFIIFIPRYCINILFELSFIFKLQSQETQSKYRVS